MRGSGATSRGGGWEVPAPPRRAREGRHCYRFAVRRGLTIVLLLALVFAAAAVVGFWVAARTAPERLRVVAEQQLGRVLKGEVQLASLEVARAQEFPWLWLEAHGARAVLKDDITLIAGQVRARLDPLSLVLGRLGIADLRIDDVIVLFPPRPDEHPERSRVAKIMRPIELVGEFLRKHPCDIPDMQVRGLTALVPRKGKLDVLLEAGDGSLSCAGLRRDRSKASLKARVRRGAETFPGEFALEVSRERASLALQLAGAPLGRCSGRSGSTPSSRATCAGDAELVAPGEGPHTLRVALTGRNVKGPLVGGEGRPWLELDLERPRLTGTLAVSASALTLRDVELRDGEIQVGAEGELALPPKDEAAARLALELGPLAVSQAPRLLAQLPPAPREDAERALARIEAGRFSRVRIEGKGSLAELRQVAGRSPLEKPGALRIEATLINATVRLGEADRATGVGARLDFAGDRLGLAVTTGSFHERPLPRLELELTGISNVRSFEEVACREPQPQPPLAGLPRLQAWLTEESEVRDEEEQATLDWQRLALELDWVSHPTLLCSLEQVAATLEPADGRPPLPGVAAASGRGSRSRWTGAGSARRGRPAGRRHAAGRGQARGPARPALRGDAPRPAGAARGSPALPLRGHAASAAGTSRAPRAASSRTGRSSTCRARCCVSPGGAIEGRVGLDLGLADTLPVLRAGAVRGRGSARLWQAADFERGALRRHPLRRRRDRGQLRPA